MPVTMLPPSAEKAIVDGSLPVQVPPRVTVGSGAVVVVVVVVVGGKVAVVVVTSERTMSVRAR
jgi:hypothetical protein